MDTRPTMASDFESRLERLRLNLADRAAFSALIEDLWQAERRDILAEAYELRAKTVGDDEAMRLWLTVADAVSIGDPSMRRRALEQAVDRASSDKEALNDLERIFSGQSDSDGLAVLLLHQARTSNDKVTQLAAARRILTVADLDANQELGVEVWNLIGKLDRAEAPAAIERLIEFADVHGFRQGLDRAEELARSLGDDRVLIRVLDAKITLGTESRPSTLVPVYLELARLAFDLAGDPGISADYLEQAQARSPSDAPRILAAVRDISAAHGAPHPALLRTERSIVELSGEWEQAGDLAEREARVTEDPTLAAELLLRAADTWATRVGKVDRAVPLYSEAAALDPQLTRVVEERLASLSELGSGDAGDVRRARLALLRANGDWHGVHSLMRDEVQALTGNARVEGLLELADIEVQRIDRPDFALTTLDEAARHASPAHLENAIAHLFELLGDERVALDVADRLADILRAHARWADLAQLLAWQVEATEDPSRKAELSFALGILLRDRLNQHDAAADPLERACDLAPGEAEFYDAARDARLRQGRADDALRLLNREYRETQSAQRRAQLDALRAMILADHKEDLGLALDAIFTALEDAEDEPILLRTFTDLLNREDGNDVLRGIAAHHVGRGDRNRAQQLLWLSARVLGLSTDAGVAMALGALVVGVLDVVRLGELQAAVDARGVVEERIKVYAKLVDQAPTAAGRRDANITLAALYQEAGRDSDAIELLYALSEAEPEDEGHTLTLISLLEKRDDPAALAETYEKALANLAMDESAALETLRKLSEVYIGNLGREDLGINALQRILKIDPKDADALTRARGVADASDDPRVLYDTLTIALAETSDAALRAERHLELASLAGEKVGDQNAAAFHWKAAALAEELATEVRLDAAQKLIDIGTSLGDVAMLADGVAAECVASDGSDAAIERAETIIDTLTETKAFEGALQVALSAAAVLGARAPYVLDRGAQLALRCQRPDDAVSLLTLWRTAEDQVMPLDRRAQLACLIMGTDAGDELTIDVLLHDPHHADIDRAMSAQNDDALRQRIAQGLAEDAAQSDPVNAEALYRASLLFAALPEGVDRAEELWHATLDADPTHRNALNQLESLLRRKDDLGGLRDVLASRLDALSEADTDDRLKVELLRKLSELTDDDAEKEERLKAILLADLSDIPARQDLVTIYRRAERYEDLADVLDELASLEDEPAQKTKTLLALAKVAAYNLQDRKRAIEALESIVEMDPLDVSTLDRLEKLYRQEEDWDGFARTLDRKAALVDDVDDKIALWRKLGETRESKLEDLAGAVQAFERVVGAEPANLPILEELARLNALLEDWPAHLRALERQANATAIKELQAEVYVRAARAMHLHLDQHREALELLGLALEHVTADADLLEIIRGAGAAAEAWVPLANVLRRVALAESDEDTRRGIEAEIGDILDNRADDENAALAWYLECMERYHGPGPVLDAMEAFAERRGLRTQMIEVYKRLANFDPEDADVVWRGLLGAANVAEQDVERPDVAFDIMATATENPAIKERALAEIDRLAEEHKLWERHREFLSAVAEDAGEDESVQAILKRAHVEETRLADWEAAFETVVGGMQEYPMSVELREVLYRLAEENDAWEMVLKLFEVLQDDAPTDDRIALLLEMATVCGTHLNRADQAFTQHLRAWQLRPRDEELLGGLTLRAQEANRTIDLLAAFEWEAKNTDVLDEKEAALVRATQLALELELPERAATNYRQLFVLPGRTLNHLDEATERLTEAGRLDVLADAIAHVVDSIKDRGDRTTTRLRFADIALTLDDFDRAATVLSNGLDDFRKPTDLREKLCEVYEAGSMWTELAEQLEALIDASDKPEARVALGDRLRAIYLEQLGDADRATATMIRLLSDDPDPGEARNRLVEHLTMLEEWDQLVEFHMDQSLGADSDEERRVSALAAAAVVEEYLDEPKRCLRIVDGLLQKHPSDVEALEIRVRALAALGRWNDHIETLKSLADLTDGRARARAFGLAAEAYELQLFYSDRAAQMWERAVEVDATWPRPHLELARLRDESDDLRGAIGSMVRAVEALEAAESPARELADGYYRLALLLERTDDGGKRSDELLGLLERAVEADPRHADARSAYERILESSGGLEQLMILLDEELLRAQDDPARAMVLLRRAAVYAFQAQREADARKALERATQLIPGSRAPLAVHGDIAFAARRWQEAATTYRELLNDVETLDREEFLAPRKWLLGENLDAELTVIYRTRLAYALEQIGAFDDAYDLYATANLDDDAYPPAVQGLARLSLRRKNFAGARVHVENFFENVTNAPAELIAEMKEIAGRIAEAEGDTAAALALYDEAASAGGTTGKEAVERAAEAAIRAGDLEGAIPRVARMVELAATTDERVTALVQLGELHAADPRGFPEARKVLTQAIILASENAHALDNAVETLKTITSGEGGLILFDGLLEDVEESVKRGPLLIARGEIRRDIDGKTTEASARDFALALEAVPHSSAALERVVDAYGELRDFATLANVLTSTIQMLPETAVGQRIPILRALGEVYRTQLEDLDAARTCYEALRAQEPDDVRTLEALLHIYESGGEDFDESAMGVASDLVKAGELSTDIIRTLERLHYASDNIDGVLQSLQILRLANAATDREIDVLDSLPTVLPTFNAGDLSYTLYQEYIRPRKLDPSVEHLVAASANHVIETLGHTFKASGDAPPGTSVLRAQFDALAPAFGLDDAQIIINPEQSRAACSIPTTPLTISASAELFVEEDPHVVRFELARAMALARPEFVLIDALGAFEVLGFFEAAMARVCDQEPKLDDSLRRQVLRWRERLSGFVLDEPFSVATRDALPSVVEYKEFAEVVAVRTAIIASFDSHAGFQRLLVANDELPPANVEELRALCERCPAIRALVTFVLSDRYLGVRRELGLVLGGANA